MAEIDTSKTVSELEIDGVNVQLAGSGSATDEQLEAWAEVNTALEKVVGPYTIETTTASYFTFEGSTVTGWIGPNEVTEIIIPRSYSMSKETVSMNGAPINKNAIISTLTSFTEVVFCKTDGSNQIMYTSASQLSSNFNIDFPDDVVLVSLQVSSFIGQLENKLNAILSTPFVASITETEDKTYYTNVEDFTSTLTIATRTAYFSGSAVARTFFDGNDYQVTNIKGSGTNIFDYRSGFKNYANKIILLNNISTIDTAAFYNCDSLSNIDIPDSVTRIGSVAFYSCNKLTAVELGDDSQLQSIGANAFNGCSNLTSIDIPIGVTSIGNSAFYNCTSLTEITVNPNNSYYSSENGILFNKDKTILIQYPTGKSGISHIIPSGVTSIGDYAFYNCDALETVTFGENSQLESIGEDAFSNCSNLTSIKIPDSVINIGGLAFFACRALTSITVLAETPPTIQTNTFNNGPDNRVFYVPDASVNAYKTATNWSALANQIQPLSSKGGTN